MHASIFPIIMPIILIDMFTLTYKNNNNNYYKNNINKWLYEEISNIYLFLERPFFFFADNNMSTLMNYYFLVIVAIVAIIHIVQVQYFIDINPRCKIRRSSSDHDYAPSAPHKEQSLFSLFDLSL